MLVIFNSVLFLCVLNIGNADNTVNASDTSEKKIRQAIFAGSNSCGYEDDQVKTHLDNLMDFSIKSFLYIAEETSANFIYSPYSILLTLSAITEGSENRKSVDNVLGLPKDRCVKQRYYELILSKTRSSLDVTFLKTQAFVVDEHLHLKPNWLVHVPGQYQQSVIPAPIKRIPVTAAYTIRQITNVQFQSLNFTGNSVLLDSLEYTGLWKTSFPEVLLRQPFYNSEGKLIGYVDMMKTKIRAHLSYTNQNGINLRSIGLPVGRDGRYRFIISMYVGKVDLISFVRKQEKNIMKTIIENFKESRIPVEVQIPKFNLDTELDMRKVLEKMGINSLWTDPSVTK